MKPSGRFLLAVFVAGCVDLSQPPELRRGSPGPGADADAPALPDDGALPDDVASPPVDSGSPGLLDAAAEDVATTEDAPFVSDLSLVAPDLPPPPDLAPLGAKGTSCTAGRECQSGLCVDKFCCDFPCTGRCQACDLAGKQGTCSPIRANDDPDNECDAEPISSCGRDGVCDGMGACRRHAAGTVCVPGSCSGSTETAASTCTAAGTCQPGATRMCAAGHTCTGSTCGSMCKNDGECQAGFYCDAGSMACKLKGAAGAPCATNVQCATNHCADGVCCNVACDQTCYACDQPGAVGTCTPVPDGQERGLTPDCPAEAPTTCGRLGGCNGRGACRLHPDTTVCGTASCTGAIEAAAPRCTGAGACSPTSIRACSPYLCGTDNTCRTSCTSNTHCQSTHACISGVCRLVKITKLVVHDTDATNRALWILQNNFQIGVMGAHPWGEAIWANTHVASMDPGGSVLLSKEWIRVATETKKYTGGPQATLTLGAAATVYLLVDDRWGSAPAWMPSDWTKAGWKIIVNEPPTRPMLPFTAYRRPSTAGDVSLPRIGASTAYNYFVVVD